MGLVLHRLAHAEGATHQEGDIRGSLHHPAAYLLGQLGAVHGLALNAHGHHFACLGQLGQDGRPLPLQSGLDLGLGGAVRQPLLGQLGDGEAAVSAQTLGIFRRCLQVKLLLHLAHADDMYTHHVLTPPSTPRPRCGALRTAPPAALQSPPGPPVWRWRAGCSPWTDGPAPLAGCLAPPPSG